MKITHHPWRELFGRFAWSIEGEWLGELNVVQTHHPTPNSYRSDAWTGRDHSRSDNRFLTWKPEIYEWAEGQLINKVKFESFDRSEIDPWTPVVFWRSEYDRELRTGQPPRLWLKDKKLVMHFKLIWGGQHDPSHS